MRRISDGLASGAMPLALGAGLLVAGYVGLVPVVVVVSAAAVIGAAAPLGQVVRVAFAGCGVGPRRLMAVGWVEMGVVAGAVTVAAPAVVPSTARPIALAGGVAVTAVTYVTVALLLPGRAWSRSGRARRACDGIVVGFSVLFAAWALRPVIEVPALALMAALAGILGVSVIGVADLRAARRPGALLCSVGSALGVVGPAWYAVLVTWQAPPRAILVAALPLMVAPRLVWVGIDRARKAPVASGTSDMESRFISYLVLTMPRGLISGTLIHHIYTGTPFDGTAAMLGVCLSLCVVCRDIFSSRDLRGFARRLSDQEARFRALVTGSSDVIVVFTEDLRTSWQSPAAAVQFGLQDRELLGRPFTDLLHPADLPRVREQLDDLVCAIPSEVRPASQPRAAFIEARIRDGAGQWRDVEFVVDDLRATPQVAAFVAHIRDIGERKQLEKALHQASFTDQLTGLPNRRELLRITTALVGGHRSGGAVLLLELHGLADINAGHGHAAFDIVLAEVAQRLRAAAGPTDLPARLSGDTFAVATPHAPVRAWALATRLLATVTQPYQLPDAAVRLSASIGIAEVAADDTAADVLYRADLAGRKAAQLGRNQIEWHDESIDVLMQRWIDVQQALPAAVAGGQLNLSYQPIIDLAENRVAGLHARLHWHHPTLGNIAPLEILAAAEDSHLANQIGEWLLTTACRQLAAWLGDGLEVWLTVTVSFRQLRRARFLHHLNAALASHEVPPNRLVIEICENDIGADEPLVHTRLAAMSAGGVRTALGHLGAGYTSVAHLRRLPLDFVKIDATAFTDLSHQPSQADQSLSGIEAAIGLGRRIGVQIIADGLEDLDQLTLVQNFGCQFAQGPLFTQPRTAEHIEEFLDNHRIAPPKHRSRHMAQTWTSPYVQYHRRNQR